MDVVRGSGGGVVRGGGDDGPDRGAGRCGGRSPTLAPALRPSSDAGDRGGVGTARGRGAGTALRRAVGSERGVAGGPPWRAAPWLVGDRFRSGRGLGQRDGDQGRQGRWRRRGERLVDRMGAATATALRSGLRLLDNSGALPCLPSVLGNLGDAHVLAGSPGGTRTALRPRQCGRGCGRRFREGGRSLFRRCGRDSRSGGGRGLQVRGRRRPVDRVLAPAGHTAHRSDRLLTVLRRTEGRTLPRTRDRHGCGPKRLRRRSLRALLLLRVHRHARKSGTRLRPMGVSAAAGAASGAGRMGGVRRRRRVRGRYSASVYLGELASGFGSTFHLATLASTHGLLGHAGSLQVAGVIGTVVTADGPVVTTLLAAGATVSCCARLKQ